MHNWTYKDILDLLVRVVDSDSSLQELSLRSALAAQHAFGRRVYLRGLVEIGNVCRNNCYYCGIRAANSQVARYVLSPDEILRTCRKGYAMGFRTFVLQGGENPALTDSILCGTLKAIKDEMPECAITLSLGERAEDSFRRLYLAGADRYLLRHEAVDRELFYSMHPEPVSEDPDDMSQTTNHARRFRSLQLLKDIGYQTGTGFMIGVPGQKLEHIAADMMFIFGFSPQMVGIGPYMPHPQTPFGNMKDAFWSDSRKLRVTLACIAILRLWNPSLLIPSTTALNTLDAGAEYAGILAGANVIMPNISPPHARRSYTLYSGKVTDFGDDSDTLARLKDKLCRMGYHADMSRGDYKENN